MVEEVKVKEMNDAGFRHWAAGTLVELRVEGEDALVVSSDQQQRRQIFGQRLQPAHVEGAGHRPLPGQRHASAQRPTRLVQNNSGTGTGGGTQNTKQQQVHRNIY